MEQILFLHQFVKMLLNGSKWDLSSVYLRNKKKIISFSLNRPPPRFSAHGRSRLGLPPRPPLTRPTSGPVHLACPACLHAAPCRSRAPCPDQRQSVTATWRPCTGDACRTAATVCLRLHARLPPAVTLPPPPFLAPAVLPASRRLRTGKEATSPFV